MPRGALAVTVEAPRDRRRVGGRMKCYSLLLGARNTPGHGKRFSAGDEALIRDITFRHFPNGFTILNADGGWFDPAQARFIEEDSRQILVCTGDRTRLRRWCIALASALQQDELLVVEEGPAVLFRVRTDRPMKRLRR